MHRCSWSTTDKSYPENICWGGGGEILNLHRRKIVVIHNHGKVHADVSTMMDLDLFPSKTIGVCDAGWIHPDQSKFILYRDLSQNIRKPLNFTQYIWSNKSQRLALFLNAEKVFFPWVKFSEKKFIEIQFWSSLSWKDWDTRTLVSKLLINDVLSNFFSDKRMAPLSSTFSTISRAPLSNLY